MQTVFMSKQFYRELGKSTIRKEDLDDSIKEILAGLSNPLGHKLHKKRIGSQHKGKRGSYRSIVYYRKEDFMIFMYLFAKNDKENLSPIEFKRFILIARELDKTNLNQINLLCKKRELIPYGEKQI